MRSPIDSAKAEAVRFDISAIVLAVGDGNVCAVLCYCNKLFFLAKGKSVLKKTLAKREIILIG